jgi:tRNA modification GTPase
LPAEAYVFRSPRSYTRQDIVELHTVGSAPVLGIVLEQLIASGARLAEPGEFTARAFFNGALDLTRAEGVAAVIHAQNDSQLRASQALLQGHLHQQMISFRDELADLLALIEAEIDFVEEPIEFVSVARQMDVLQHVGSHMQQLITESPSAERLSLLPEVVLAGPPNAGKSTLLNRLSGMDRAIQSALPGTTRDLLSAPWMLPAGEVMLVDTAGLSFATDAFQHSVTGSVDQQAQSLAQQKVQQAEMVLLVIDMQQSVHEIVSAFRASTGVCPDLVIRNKCDLMESVPGLLTSEISGVCLPILSISAATGQGCDQLLEAVNTRLFQERSTTQTELIALSDRQRSGMIEAHAAVERAIEIINQTDDDVHPAELIALELREAVHALSLLVGDVVTEDLLSRVFARFCIGK